jgi:hypothetical protein
LVILGAAFNFVGYGRWTLLLVITGGVLAIVDRGVKQEPDPATEFPKCCRQDRVVLQKCGGDFTQGCELSGRRDSLTGTTTHGATLA